MTFVVTVMLAGSFAHAAEWKLARDENGIAIHTRPVDGSGIDEFRGVAEVDASTEALVALLRDSARLKEWFPNTPESRLIDRNGSVSNQYSVLATPWPTSDRDNVLRSVLSRDETTGVVEITLAANPDHYPLQSGRVRVRRANGLWLFEPLSESRTRVTFQMHLEPGGGIPQWMINARVVETPFEALTNLRTVVAR